MGGSEVGEVGAQTGDGVNSCALLRDNRPASGRLRLLEGGTIGFLGSRYRFFRLSM